MLQALFEVIKVACFILSSSVPVTWYYLVSRALFGIVWVKYLAGYVSVTKSHIWFVRVLQIAVVVKWFVVYMSCMLLLFGLIKLPSLISLRVIKLPSLVSLGFIKLPSQVSLGVIKLPSLVSLGFIKLPSQVSLGVIKLPSQVSLGVIKLPSQVSLGVIKLPSRVSLGVI